MPRGPDKIKRQPKPQGILTVKGVLEIDKGRGVIYFTPTEGERAGATLLRICRLPLPIPNTDLSIDITLPQQWPGFSGISYGAGAS